MPALGLDQDKKVGDFIIDANKAANYTLRFTNAMAYNISTAYQGDQFVVSISPFDLSMDQMNQEWDQLVAKRAEEEAKYNALAQGQTDNNKQEEDAAYIGQLQAYISQMEDYKAQLQGKLQELDAQEAQATESLVEANLEEGEQGTLPKQESSPEVQAFRKEAQGNIAYAEAEIAKTQAEITAYQEQINAASTATSEADLEEAKARILEIDSQLNDLKAKMEAQMAQVPSFENTAILAVEGQEEALAQAQAEAQSKAEAEAKAKAEALEKAKAESQAPGSVTNEAIVSIAGQETDPEKAEEKETPATEAQATEARAMGSNADYVKIGTYTSDGNGLILVGDLKEGNYYFKELQAPEGYTGNLATKYEFSVPNAKTPSEPVAVTVTNQPNETPVEPIPEPKPENQYTNIFGRKSWQGDTEADRPESITVELVNKATDKVERNLRVNGSSNWTYSFEKVLVKTQTERPTPIM